jgi:hypothetical protein
LCTELSFTHGFPRHCRIELEFSSSATAGDKRLRSNSGRSPTGPLQQLPEALQLLASHSCSKLFENSVKRPNVGLALVFSIPSSRQTLLPFLSHDFSFLSFPFLIHLLSLLASFLFKFRCTHSLDFRLQIFSRPITLKPRATHAHCSYLIRSNSWHI